MFKNGIMKLCFDNSNVVLSNYPIAALLLFCALVRKIDRAYINILYIVRLIFLQFISDTRIFLV